jgi:formate dehydrogenase subunit gamma
VDEATDVRDIAERYAGRIGGPITALRKIVEACGQIRRAHMETVADVFNLSVAEVRGIVSFYSDLRTEPAGRKHIRICQAEACQAVGARALTAAVTETLGIGLGETAADGSVSLEAVYCLGLCTSGPNATVNGRPLVRATPGGLTG